MLVGVARTFWNGWPEDLEPGAQGWRDARSTATVIITAKIIRYSVDLPMITPKIFRDAQILSTFI